MVVGEKKKKATVFLELHTYIHFLLLTVFDSILQKSNNEKNKIS